MPRDQRIKAARKIVADAQKTTGSQPIETAPREPERTLLLFCPEQAGWQAGQWQHGRWIQRVSRSSWTRRTGGRSRPIRQESGKSPPKKSTADDGCRRGDKAPYVPDETCARCLLVLRALGGEFGRPYGSPGCTFFNPKLRRFLVVLLAASQARSWR